MYMCIFETMEGRIWRTYYELINQVIKEQNVDHIDTIKIILMDIKEVEYVRKFIKTYNKQCLDNCINRTKIINTRFYEDLL